jgi:hypothetical protein
MKILTRLAFAWAALLVTAASAQYSTGFENPPFVPANPPTNSGTINGQDSWTSTSPDNARILTATQIADTLAAAGLTPGMTVHGGSQALLVSGTGGQSATIRAVAGLSGENVVIVDVWARPLTAGNTGAPIGNTFLTMEDSANVRAAAFRFGIPNAGPQSIDYGTNVMGIWQATGQTWDTNTWYQMRMVADYSAKTYDFFINGAKVNDNPIPFYTATSANFDHIRIFRGTNQAGMIVDDLFVGVPEPTSAACLLVGGSGLLLWRRRSPSRLPPRSRRAYTP